MQQWLGPRPRVQGAVATQPPDGGSKPQLWLQLRGSCRMVIAPTWFSSVQFSRLVVSDTCLTLCDPVDCSTPGLASTLSQSLLKAILSNHLIFCHSLLPLPSIFPSIRVFSNELTLCIRWPKYWSFSFSNSPFSEYSGLISFRID